MSGECPGAQCRILKASPCALVTRWYAVIIRQPARSLFLCFAERKYLALCDVALEEQLWDLVVHHLEAQVALSHATQLGFVTSSLSSFHFFKLLFSNEEHFYILFFLT